MANTFIIQAPFWPPQDIKTAADYQAGLSWSAAFI